MNKSKTERKHVCVTITKQDHERLSHMAGASIAVSPRRHCPAPPETRLPGPGTPWLPGSFERRVLRPAQKIVHRAVQIVGN